MPQLDSAPFRVRTHLPPLWQSPNTSTVLHLNSPTSKGWDGDKGFRFTREFATALGHELLAFISWLEPGEGEKKERQDLCARVKHIIAELWPSASVNVFGSTETGLALPNSDVDFVVEEFDFDKGQHMTDISAAMRENMMEIFLLLPHTKVPLVKFRDPVTNLCGDVSFCVPNAVKSTALLKTYLLQFPVAKPIIIVAKALLKQNNMNSVHTGGLSSHAVSLLVICFLRQRAAEQRDRKKGKHEASRPFIDFRVVSAENVGQLLLDFFCWFADLEMRYVFSPEDEKPQPKTGRWFVNEHPYLLALKDPLDPQNDITRGTYNIEYVQVLFYYSLQALFNYCPGTAPSILSTFINPRDQCFLQHAKKRQEAIIFRNNWDMQAILPECLSDHSSEGGGASAEESSQRSDDESTSRATTPE